MYITYVKAQKNHESIVPGTRVQNTLSFFSQDIFDQILITVELADFAVTFIT